MDDLYRHLFSVLIDRRMEDGVSAGVETALLGRFYERFAEQAVEVGRRVIFAVTGDFASGGPDIRLLMPERS